MKTGTASRPAPPHTGSPPRPRRTGSPLSPRGPLWLAWRRQRTVLVTGGVLILALAGYLVYQRTGMAALIHDRGVADCRLWRDCNGAPLESSDRLSEAFVRLETYRAALLDTARLLLAIPAVIGAFVGAPLIAREFESGTAALVWSQSVGRVRWLLATLALPVVATLAATTLLAALFTWWWWPVRGTFPDVQWGDTLPFDVMGPAFVSLSLLSLFLGTAFGLVLRRTLPAMACTLAVTAGVVYGLQQLRPHLMPRFTVTAGVRVHAEAPFGGWYVGSGYLDGTGARVDGSVCTGLGGWPAIFRCLDRRHLAEEYEDYHPIGHFWPMQWVQAGICLAVAVALAASCVWWIGRRRA
ncbi:transporter [Streptomyces sp. NPDC094472]|uniref:transporter n=1 Tax=unclassified Streptomyces TaxID=2593676 RepID=UPI00332E2AAC